MRVEPCNVWATEADLPDVCDVAAVAPDVLELGFAWGSEILYNLTERRWPGVCHDEVWLWVDCDYPGRYGCYHASINLPSSRVLTIEQVEVNGVTLDPADYELRDGYRLFRLDDLSWPCSYTEADPRVRVAFTFGANPPATAKRMAAILGYEVALSMTPNCGDRCRLPRNSTVTRGGVTVTPPDIGRIIEAGRVGLNEIDMWLGAIRRGEHAEAEIVVPGQPRPYQRF